MVAKFAAVVAVMAGSVLGDIDSERVRGWKRDLQGPDLCNQRDSELACAAELHCYWANWTDITVTPAITEPRCLPFPTSSADCKCTLESGCSSGLSLGWRGPSGCAPVEFCRFRLGNGCILETDLRDSNCVEDGDYTMNCVPSNFCEPRVNASKTKEVFNDGDCVLKASATKYPTRFPTTSPPVSSEPPVQAPTTQVGPTAAPGAESELLVPIAVGGSLAIVCGIGAGMFLVRYNRHVKQVDTEAAVGVAMAIRAVRTAAELHKQEKEEELAQARQRGDTVPDF